METLQHQIQDWSQLIGWPTEAFVRLVLAAMAGALIGFEREVRGRNAGFRTNLLVCLGSALVMLVSIEFARLPWQKNPGFTVTVDPARVAYGVMAGIGFLGAGAILKQNGSVRGLTTAAAMWCVAAIGLAFGLGMYLLGGFATMLVLAALWVLNRLESVIPSRFVRLVTLRLNWEPGCLSGVVRWLESAGYHVRDASFRRLDDPALVDATVSVAIRAGSIEKLERLLQEQSSYKLMAIEIP